MQAERLKVDRALSIQLPQRRLRLLTDRPDPRELPTDPIGTEPPVNETSPPPPMHEIPPQARAEPQPDPNSYSDFVLSEIRARYSQLVEREAAIDFKTLLDRQTENILKETAADIGLIRSSITGLQQSVDAVVTRIGNTESALDAGVKHFARLDNGIAALVAQMEDLRQQMADIEVELNRLKEGARVAAETTPTG